MSTEFNHALTAEQSFFLLALSDYILEKPTQAIPTNVDTNKLAALSNEQQLSSVLYYQTHIPALQPKFASAVYYAENRKRLLGQIAQEFGAAHIQYLVFKGSEVARYYQHSYLRTSGDIDLMVRLADKARAGEILEKLGFASPEHTALDHEWVYTKGDLEIELHHRLLYDGDNLNGVRLTSFTDAAWEHAELTGGTCYHLKPEFHFVFLLLHLRKHLLWAGAGIRLFVDLAVMIRNANLNWDQLEEFIRICEIEQFASVCFSLIHRWFGVPVPFRLSELSDDFYWEATGTVLSDGVFGDTGHENIVENEAANAVRRRGKSRAVLSVIFPPYEQMKAKYPAACGKDAIGKLLLPFLWIRRMAESVRKRTTADSLRYAGKYMTVDQERVTELKAWGIL